jgi:hypothetical protein
LSNKYGSFEFSIKVAADKLVVLRKLELRQSEIPVADYETLKSFINAIAEHDRKKVILKLNQKV